MLRLQAPQLSLPPVPVLPRWCGPLSCTHTVHVPRPHLPRICHSRLYYMANMGALMEQGASVPSAAPAPPAAATPRSSRSC